ncbi:MAG: hypothetical protein WAU68_12060 [Vitreimonas sp.]
MAYVIIGLTLALVGGGIVFAIKTYGLLNDRDKPTPLRSRDEISHIDAAWNVGGRSSQRRGLLQRMALSVLGAAVVQQATTRNSAAQNGHIDVPGPGGSYADIPAHHYDHPRPHSDNPHSDHPHSDHPHSDHPHSDHPHSDHPPHNDTPHQDSPHGDSR